MSDRDPLRARFAAYRGELTTHIDGPGPEAARRTLRHRRRTAVAAGAAMAVALVVAPIAAGAALRQDPPQPPAVTPTAEPTPSASPSVNPTPTPSTSPTGDPPDGRITRKQLLAARLDLPDWPSYAPLSCLTRDVRLRGEEPNDMVPELLGDPAYGDLDRDGATETVALIACRYGEAMAKQLVAFDRDDAGRIVTMGRVVGTQRGMDDILGFSVASGGKVRARVADTQPCCGMPGWSAQQQSRTYAWTGDAFTQTAGPTEFGTDPRLTDLTLRAGDLVLGAADASGKRIGSVTVTVTNKGPVDVPGLGFRLFTVGEPAGGDLSRCRTESMQGDHVCVLDGLRAGKSRTYTFRFRVDPGGVGDLEVVHFDGQGRWWSDLHRDDNSVNLRVVG